MTFTGKTGVVTGGTHGLGVILVKQLVEAGARVIVVGRNLKAGQQLEQQMPHAIRFVACDISHEAQVAQLFLNIEQQEGALHFAVNNAGVTSPRAPIHSIDMKAWKQVLDVNLNGALLCLKHELQLISKTKGGTIVNVSSCAGVLPYADQAAYSVSKAALNCLTQVAAIENAQDHEGRHAVRVNAIAPGPILGGMNTPERLAANPEATRKKLAITAMGRMAAPEEIVASIMYLLSDASSYMTGTILNTDGGYSSGKF